MSDLIHNWRHCWRRSPGVCLAFGACCLGHVAVPIGVGGAILVVSVWFAPDLTAASIAQLVGIFLFYIPLPIVAARLTSWLNRRYWQLRLRLAWIASQAWSAPV